MNKTKSNPRPPSCYGELAEVFPLQESGFRQSPEKCLTCLHKKKCLQEAMDTDEGLKIQEEAIDRANQAGMISFLERWSRIKLLRQSRERKQK